MSVTADDLRTAIAALELGGRALCLHSSLRSFGHVEGGADAVVEAFLDEGCTLLVPTFSWGAHGLPPQPGMQPERNGIDEAPPAAPVPAVPTAPAVFTPDSNQVDRSMGAIPAAVLARPGRVRGNNPLSSFTALGPLASSLVAPQSPIDVFAPLARLARGRGAIVLAGVGLRRMTLLHLAEQRAGRVSFRRWALGVDGEPTMVARGGCSEGFENLAKHLANLERREMVGESTWRVLDARSALNVAIHAIRRDPRVTHCGDETCIRCRDAIAGGPILG